MSEHLPHSSFPVLSGGPPPFPGASLVAQMVKNPPAMQGDLGLTPGSGRPPGGGQNRAEKANVLFENLAQTVKSLLSV